MPHLSFRARGPINHLYRLLYLLPLIPRRLHRSLGEMASYNGPRVSTRALAGCLLLRVILIPEALQPFRCRPLHLLKCTHRLRRAALWHHCGQLSCTMMMEHPVPVQCHMSHDTIANPASTSMNVYIRCTHTLQFYYILLQGKMIYCSNANKLTSVCRATRHHGAHTSSLSPVMSACRRYRR